MVFFDPIRHPSEEISQADQSKKEDLILSQANHQQT